LHAILSIIATLKLHISDESSPFFAALANFNNAN